MNPTNRYRNFVLGMLTFVYVFNFIDRQLIVILQEAIKKELQLSDTQLGMLSGLTFAVFYVTLGIPVAHLADRSNRKTIVAASLAVWSFMTAACGMAGNYGQLLLARIGVGVGEAGGSPPAHALISDYFPPEKRSTALSIYSMGIYFGMLIGFIMGGYLNQTLGWRNAFLALGIPGVLFSLLFFWLVKEPRKLGVSSTANALPFGQVLRTLLSNRTFLFLTLSASMNTFAIYGMSNWAPSFLARIHGMSSLEIGKSLGLIFGIGGALGSYLGGYLTDRLGKKEYAYYLKIPGLAVGMAALFSLLALFSTSVGLAMVGFFFLVLLQSTYLGPSISVAHGLVSPTMRALTSAVFFLFINLIGLGLGPLTVGLLSDALKDQVGVESIRYGMAVTVLFGITSALGFFRTSGRLKTQPGLPQPELT